jgi:hypothetical protein
MAGADELRQQAEAISSNGVLGKPGALSRLFDFLLERSLAGESPKEVEIALQVFGKSGGFDVSQDSVVRVYVHKLRRRLDEFYARRGAPASGRIVIPKGEYRLTIEHSAATAVVEPGDIQVTVPALVSRPWRRRALAGVALVLAMIVGAAVAVFSMGLGGGDKALRDIRASAVWAPLLADDLPITIVVGDYYLLGETDAEGNGIRRMVREFFINSPDDFVYQVEANPKLMEKYRNLNLTYLPTSTAFALQEIAPILGASKRVRVVTVSQLNGAMLKNSHIVYIGYISGMGMLGESVFAASRLSPGGSFDELVDRATNTQYVSIPPETTEASYTDYGYFSSFSGPANNRIVIISGTRDTGVMHVADALSRPTEVADMVERAGGAPSFESLYEVYGMAGSGMNAKRLFVSGLKPAQIWSARN